MPRKAIGDRPMTDAERQARRRQIVLAERDAALRNAETYRVTLAKISDRTSERLRTKAALEAAIDEIGIIAAEALTASSDDEPVGDVTVTAFTEQVRATYGSTKIGDDHYEVIRINNRHEYRINGQRIAKDVWLALKNVARERRA